MLIGLLECDDVSGRFPDVDGGYREMFAALLSPHVPGIALRYYEAHRGQLPRSPGDCDAWLCTGSKYSVYERRDWIDGLKAFVRRIGESARPFVGICFGHQMLASALGGDVAQAQQGWGVGIGGIDVLVQEPWMQPPRTRLRLHHMHADQVGRLPDGSVLLARSAHCDVEMFRVGESMLGIEGHPEFTAPFAAALIRDRRDAIGAETADRALESLRDPDDGPLVGAWIAAFLRRG
ncbi:MAG: amidotransferase [Gammaproteobacteria bacterium]|nr:amidotransferase [Gammaproteobacteria bacterium]